MMTGSVFSKIRKKLKKTQAGLAVLLGVSLKTIQSYEQGIRNIPANIERILYYLFFKMNISKMDPKELCWETTRCSENMRQHCVAWLAREGFFCWFITGKTCLGGNLYAQKDIQSCFDCPFFKEKLDKILS